MLDAPVLDLASKVKRTCAEYLLDLADEIEREPGKIVIVESGPLADWQLAQCKLALDLKHRPLSFQFRAICDELDQLELIRRLY